MCPDASFSKDINLPKGSSLYIKLASKGDKIKFRIAATPFYVTRHWTSPRTTELCEKYNSESEKPCKYCEEYDKLKAEGKKEEAGAHRPIATFSYPILNSE